MHSELRRTGHFECSDRLLNQLHRNVGVGHQGQLPRPARPTARSATSGSAGPATSRRSRRPRRTSSTSGRSCSDWLVDLALEQEHADGMVPFVVPDVLKHAARAGRVPRPRQHRDLERRRRLGAVGALAGVRRPVGAGAPVRLDGRRTCAGSRRCSPRRVCGTRRSSSATGSTRTPRRTQPWRRPRPTPGVVATACLYRSASIIAETATCSAAPTTPPSSRALADRDSRRRSTSTTSPTTAPIRSDCTTVYTLAIVFGLLDDEDRARWPASGWRSWSPRAATGSRPASPARRSSPTR